MSDSDFDKCIMVTVDGDLFTIDCIKGLWSVSGHVIEWVKREARHYFEQYKADGEYSDIIGGPSVADVMRGFV